MLVGLAAFFNKPFGELVVDRPGNPAMPTKLRGRPKAFEHQACRANRRVAQS